MKFRVNYYYTILGKNLLQLIYKCANNILESMRED